MGSLRKASAHDMDTANEVTPFRIVPDGDDALAIAESRRQHTIEVSPQVAIEKLANELELKRAAAELVRERENQRFFKIPSFQPIGTLSQHLDEEIYRSRGLILTDADTLIIGQRKTGKSTFMMNLLEALIEGGPFLGRFETIPVKGKICYIDYELGRRMFAKWANDKGLSMGADSPILYLDGRDKSNPLSSDYGRSWLTEQLSANEVETLIVDPFGVAFGGSGDENSSTEVRKWLEKLSNVRINSTVHDLILAVHGGKDASKGARGSSALEDWASSIISLYKEAKTETRKLSALGRDVMLEPTELQFHAESRTLTLKEQEQPAYLGLNRTEDALLNRIVAIITEADEPLNQTQLKEALGDGFDKNKISPITKKAVEAGLISVTQKGRSLQYGKPEQPSGPPTMDLAGSL